MIRYFGRRGNSLAHYLAIAIAAVDLSACGGGGSSSTSNSPSAVTNHPPAISGSPSGSVSAGAAYGFYPTAADPDGNTLQFTISNQPAWASFDPASGSLTGTPGSQYAGTATSNIVISVSDGQATVALPAFTIQVQAAPPPPASNQPPVILGTPASSVSVGQAYSFRPSASDPNGDTLTFSITNKPAWASFNPSNGRLNGTPSAADAGTYDGIVISVSDASTSASLAPFTITVTQVSTGSATLSWLPPLQNEDGTALTDLAGYRIFYGTNASALSEVVELSNPGLTTYMIQGLAPATWYFEMRSYRTDGTESQPSAIMSKTIS